MCFRVNAVNENKIKFFRVVFKKSVVFVVDLAGRIASYMHLPTGMDIIQILLLRMHAYFQVAFESALPQE